MSQSVTTNTRVDIFRQNTYKLLSHAVKIFSILILDQGYCRRERATINIVGRNSNTQTPTTITTI